MSHDSGHIRHLYEGSQVRMTISLDLEDDDRITPGNLSEWTNFGTNSVWYVHLSLPLGSVQKLRESYYGYADILVFMPLDANFATLVRDQLVAFCGLRDEDVNISSFNPAEKANADRRLGRPR